MGSRIITLGDSTMQFNNYLKFPQTGWPQALVRFLKPDVEILNFAVNGKSTKNFISLGLFDNALNNMKKDDLVLIEFGHNDAKKEDPTRFTEPFKDYQENLKFMVEACRSKGAHVILLTSITERKFSGEKLIDCRHSKYPEAMMVLAEQINVPCIDMYKLTREVLSKEGPDASKRFYMNFGKDLYISYPDGLEDDTHLRYDGAYMVARCFYEEMLRKKLYVDLFLQ